MNILAQWSFLICQLHTFSEIFLYKLKIQTPYHRLWNKPFFREECFASHIRSVSSCPCNHTLALNPGHIGNYCNLSSFFNWTITVWASFIVLIIVRGWFAIALYSVTFKSTSQARLQLQEKNSTELKCTLWAIPKPNKKLKRENLSELEDRSLCVGMLSKPLRQDPLTGVIQKCIICQRG